MPVRLSAAAVILLAGLASAGAAGLEANTNRPGGDYTSFPMRRPLVSACASSCAADTKCYSWTYVRPGLQGRYARCWLKGSIPKAVPDACCTSGVTRLMQFPGKLKVQ